MERSIEDARPSASGRQAARRPRRRLKRILLAAAIALLALNVWTGSPLLAVWLGSRVQAEESQPSMAAFAVVLVSLIVFSLVLYQLLKLTMRAYRKTTGTTPTVRTRAAWLRSMRDERPGSPKTSTTITGAERVVVLTVVIAVVAFEVWFFFFSGSPIGGLGGR
jgi:predicted secreted protein